MSIANLMISKALGQNLKVNDIQCNSIEISGSITGPTGSTFGTPGPTGPQGIQGPTGPAMGDPGPIGPTGSNGPTGAQGTQGIQGPTGSMGSTGLQGATGSQGSQGIQGPTGSAGLISLNGLLTSSAPNQIFAVGTAGTNFNIASTGTTHTFNIPLASTTATGLMDTTTQSFTGAKTFAGTVAVSNIMSCNDILDSSTPTTGSLVVVGGMGLGKTLRMTPSEFLYCDVIAAANQTAPTPSVLIDSSSVFLVENGTNATSQITGAIQTFGGIGCVGDIYADNYIGAADVTCTDVYCTDITAQGHITANGNITGLNMYGNNLTTGYYNSGIYYSTSQTITNSTRTLLIMDSIDYNGGGNTINLGSTGSYIQFGAAGWYLISLQNTAFTSGSGSLTFVSIEIRYTTTVPNASSDAILCTNQYNLPAGVSNMSGDCHYLRRLPAGGRIYGSVIYTGLGTLSTGSYDPDGQITRLSVAYVGS